MWEIILIIVLSLVSGLAAGMGMGGGTLLIPALTMFVGFKQKNAQGLNLLAFLPMGIVSLIIHIKNKLINFKVGLPIMITGSVACVAGSIIANNIKNQSLQFYFGIFLLGIAGFQIFSFIKSICNKKNQSNG